MKRISKLLAVLLVLTVLLPGIAAGVVQAAPTTEGAVTRLEGKDRIATAISVSKNAFADGSSDSVVLAGFGGQADALSGTLLASSKKAPLLFTLKNEVRADLKAELDRLGVDKVFIVGGNSVVSEAVETALDAAGYEVKRFAGKDRVETAVQVAAEVESKHAFLAKGYGSLADALAVGPASVKENSPILLTETNKLPEATKDALEDLGVTEVTIVGGTSAVSAAVANQLRDNGITVDRISGSNREATAVEIAKEYFADSDNAVIANGYAYADALAGGYFAAMKNAPILLAQAKKLDEGTTTYIEDNVETAYLLGGTNALSAGVATDVEEAIESELKVLSVSAINPTSILVEFNTDVPAENAGKANFSVSAGTLEAVNVSGKTATLSMKGLNYGQEVQVSVVDPNYTGTVVVPKVEDLFKLEMSTDAEGNTIKSDGATKMQIEVILKDKTTGEIVEKDAVVDFTATRGGLGQTRSALEDGKGYVQLTSIASPVSVTSTVTAVLAEVPGSEEFEGLTGQERVFFTPDGAAEEVELVRAMSAESTQGDRFFVQFSAPIKAAEYKAIVEATNWPAANKYGVAVNNKLVNVSDVRNVAEDTLEFILDVDQPGGFDRIEKTTAWTGGTAPNNYLRDNVTHTVTFPNKVGRLVLDETTGIDFILTDTSRPAVLGVTAKDQLEFTARFTETVDRQTVVEANFLIDGKGVVVNPAPGAPQIAAAKSANKVIVTSLTVGKYWKGIPRVAVDERNEVTFVLHKDFALASGSHQIQIANVGDYAQDVDPVQNKVVTDTFDFTVTADTSIPVPTITVQSPEQWRVDFDKAVYGTTGKKVEDVFKVKSKESDDTFVMGTDYMVSSINKNGTTGTALVPSASASTLDGEQYFLIEFLADWTVKYDTKNNPLKTYFASTKNPYTVTIENLESSIGNKMSKKDLNVNLAYDGVSPEIANAEQAKDIDGNLLQAVNVKMTEPIKNVNPSQLDTLTPSQQQTAGAGVPEPTYEFVKGDKVVEGVATSFSYDDYRFTLVPEAGKTLEAGEWTLYIKSISDDTGNTSATVSKKLVIVEDVAVATDTQIAWAAFDDADGTGKLLFDTTVHGDKDVIYVKYTKEMKAGGANGVDRTQNYVFMGQPLPTGSQVLRGIEGVTKDWDGVTIVMPKGTWDGVGGGKDDFTVALNIASNFQAADGEKLSGDYEVELTDTTTDNTTLGGGFEAVYYGAIPFKNNIATTEAVAEGNADGNIAKITLSADAASGAYDPSDVIYVNGKKFVRTGVGVFTPDTATSVKLEGTATDGLKITSVNGAIIVNTGQVEDDAKPVITKTALSTDKKTVTLTFSERVTQATNGTFLELVKTNFAVSVGTIDSVEHNAATANTVVLKLDTAVVPAVAVNAVANSVYDFAQPANFAAATPVTLMPAYAMAPTITGLAAGSSQPFTVNTQVDTTLAAGATDSTGVLDTFLSGTADTFQFTVTDGGSATSTITIDGVAYTSGDDYTVTAAQATAGNVEIVVTTTEVGKTTAVRTFVVAVN